MRRGSIPIMTGLNYYRAIIIKVRDRKNSEQQKSVRVLSLLFLFFHRKEKHMKLKNLLSKAVDLGNKAKEHDSAIMTAVGIGGSVAGLILALRNSPKIREILADEELSSKEKLKELIPLLGPIAAAEGLSIAAIIGLFKKSQKLSKLLAAAVTTGSTMASLLKETEEKTKELVGEEKAEEIKKAVQEGAAKTNAAVIDTGEGDTLFVNGSTGLSIRSSKAFISTCFKEAQVYAAKERASAMGYVPDNVYITLGDIDWLLSNRNEKYIIPKSHDMLGYPVRELGKDGRIDYYLSPFEYEDPTSGKAELAYNIVITPKLATVPDDGIHMPKW